MNNNQVAFPANGDEEDKTLLPIDKLFYNLNVKYNKR